MTSTTPAPRRYLDILDRHAGREHSEEGSVATALAEILALHADDVRAEPRQQADATLLHVFKPGPISSGLCAFRKAGTTCGRAEAHHFHHPAPEQPSAPDFLAAVNTLETQLADVRRERDKAQRQADDLRGRLERGHICTAACRPNKHVAFVGRHALNEALAEVERLKLAVKLGQTARAELEGRLREGRGPWPAESGPIVLTLPEGAISVVGVAVPHRRYEPFGDLPFEESPAWRRVDDGTLFAGLGGVLDAEPRGVTVEMAPPREPRTWDAVEPRPGDLNKVEVAGRIWTFDPEWSRFIDDKRVERRTWTELRTLGTVTEVIG